MNRARVALGFAVSVTTACVGLFACSSSNGTSTTGDAVPTATVAAKDAAVPDTYSPPGDSSVTPQDAGSECGTAAVLHAPKPDGGVFCPFSAPTGGKNIYCSVAQECCENPKGGGVSTCETKGSACPNAAATVWECEDPSDCPGQKCCAHGSAGTAVTIGTDTCGPYLSKFSGTKCAATCAAGELVVCEQQSECTTGTCIAVKPKGNDIGVCQ
jgi:hypothetical protein